MNPDTPTWQQIERMIPPYFMHRRDLSKPYPPGNHNGASSPFRFMYPYIYSPETRVIIDDASYIHDWGYMYGRLLGSGTSFMTRKEWDRTYRQYYIDHGCPHVARLHYTVLRPLGWRAWNRNMKYMASCGDTDYEIYMARNLAEAAMSDDTQLSENS